MDLELMLRNMTFNESEVDPFEIQVLDQRSANHKTTCMITFFKADPNLKSTDPGAVKEALKTVTLLAEGGFASNSVCLNLVSVGAKGFTDVMCTNGTNSVPKAVLHLVCG